MSNLVLVNRQLVEHHHLEAKIAKLKKTVDEEGREY